MNAWRKWWRTRLTRRMSSLLRPHAPLGALSDEEHAVIHALLQVITNDVAVDDLACRRYIDEKMLETPGAADAYRRAVLLLEQSSHRHYGKSFSKLSLVKRDWLLHWLFIAFPHEERLPGWARRARIVPHKLSLIFETGDFRALRHYVMPELLAWYYTTDRGWSIVGWNDFPGKARVE